MARASAKRGRRPRANAQPAKPVANEPSKQTADAVPLEPVREAPVATPEKKAVKVENKAQPKAAKQRSQRPEDTMFFMRLRTHAKWVFAFLAAAFAIGFLAFGVGTGVNGASLGDVLHNIFGGGSGTPSISEAQKKVDENPNDAQALRDLATAQQAGGQPKAAAATLESLLKLTPGDTTAASQLAGFYDAQARDAATRSSNLQSLSLSGTFAQQAFSFPGTTGFLGALGSGPIDEAIQRQLAAEAADANQEALDLYAKETAAFKKVTLAKPKDPTGYIQLGQAAAAAGQTDVALTAFKKFVELAPDDPNVKFAKDQIASLEQQLDAQG